LNEAATRQFRHVFSLAYSSHCPRALSIQALLAPSDTV
jgi:hypothetical protein